MLWIEGPKFVFRALSLSILLLLTALPYCPHSYLLSKKDGLLFMVRKNDCRQPQISFFFQLATLERGKLLLVLLLHMKSQQRHRLIDHSSNGDVLIYEAIVKSAEQKPLETLSFPLFAVERGRGEVESCVTFSLPSMYEYIALQTIINVSISLLGLL